MAATPDYLVGHDGLLECKTTAHGGGWGPTGSDEFPEGYLVQVLHQMECLQRSVGYLAVLIGGSDFRWYTIRDQPALRAKIVEIEREFWRAVEDCIPPEPDWTHPETPRLAALLNRPDPAASVQLDSEAQLWAESYERMGREIAGLESERAKCKGRLIDAMGGAGVGVLPDGRKVTRKLQHRKGYSVEATLTEQFRILGKPIHSQDEEMI
jgi:predicted phage-related endonuclease